MISTVLVAEQAPSVTVSVSVCTPSPAALGSNVLPEALTPDPVNTPAGVPANVIGSSFTQKGPYDPVTGSVTSVTVTVTIAGSLVHPFSATTSVYSPL